MNMHPRRRILPKRVAGAALAALLVAPCAVSHAQAPAAGEPAEEAPAHVGFELGRFVLRNYRPIQGEKVRVTFTLHASTLADEADGFERRLERRRMRVRDQVITAMRLADPEEFEDPELRLIRRRLFLRLGRALPDLPIEEVYFSEFRYVID